jgi:hypothetical protein
MDADSAAAGGAGPSALFGADKSPDTGFLNISQVFDHAHVVFSTVSLIQMLHCRARERTALKAELESALLHGGTVQYFAPHAGNGFSGILSPAPGAPVPLPQVGHAEPAVHPACCDKFSVIQWSHASRISTFFFFCK